MNFCSRHRSFFCPCVAPWMYVDGAASLAEWDADPALSEERKDEDEPSEEAMLR